MKARASRAWTLLVLTALAVGLSAVPSSHPRPLADAVVAQVPAAAAFFGERPQVFAALPEGGFRTAVRPSAAAPEPGLITEAPQVATSDFELRRRGGERRATVHLVAAAPVSATLEAGVVFYRGAYPGIDVVSLSGSDDLELLYVARGLPSTGQLRLDLGVKPGETLDAEPSTGALLLRDAQHRPRLRLAQPVAADARGLHRTGRYESSSGEVRLAFDWTGMTPPVVIDPMVTVPFWSILSDARVPGAAEYDRTLLSREEHLAYDSVRGRTVAVRPVRPRLGTDTTFITGNASLAPRTGLPSQSQLQYEGLSISSQPAIFPGDPTASAAALADFTRGLGLESETWEWSGSTWSIVDSAHLPGLIDPSLAFDAARGRMVLFGGVPQSAQYCRLLLSPSFQSNTAVECLPARDDANVTYEYDGSTWTPKRVPNAPPPRLRAAMAWSPVTGQTLLFGGRALADFATGHFRQVDVNGSPFPENMTADLMNDTWAYDGASWTAVPTGTPPPPREGAQLVYDPTRNVFVLVGGHSADETAPKVDRLGIWEFDGVDWTQKLAPADATQPVSIATRRATSAFYNPSRHRVTLFGGVVDKLDFCSLSNSAIAAQVSASQNDPAALRTLQATGCLGGYVHDAWEWDGAALTKVNEVTFAGTVEGVPVFEQANGGAAWGTQGSAGAGIVLGSVANTSLLSYRYDRSGNHFSLRTELERAHQPPPGTLAAVEMAVGSEAGSSNSAASPLFGATVHPDMFFDSVRGVATLFAPDTAAIYDTDGSVWTTRTPQATPFSSGENDFLASAWDSVHQRIVAFDPRDGSSWTYSDSGGWSSLPAPGPGAWGFDAALHSKRDFGLLPGQQETAAFLAALPSLPRMAFDRGRGRAVMLYGQALWEFDGATWTRFGAPPTWSSCTAASLIAYDGARSRTVAFGCRVPAETWEWDGTQWSGPGPSPYTAMLPRKLAGYLSPPVQPVGTSRDWSGTVQFPWLHPNAAFESATLGGVSTFDADGSVRTWNGTAWSTGPALPTQSFCVGSLFDPSSPASDPTSATVRQALNLYPYPVDPTTWTGRQFVRMCFSPPAVEDVANHRLVALRDGPLGTMELPLSDPPAQRAWRPQRAGPFETDDAFAVPIQVNPYPFDLMAPESIRMLTESDPASRTGAVGSGPQERPVENLWWPYRLFPDPASGRVRVMTSRGMVWELQGQPMNLLGSGCTTDADCGEGTCGTEGVCCDVGRACTENNLCFTCKGAVPGLCGPIANGSADPLGRCGTGSCAAVCQSVGAGAMACVNPQVGAPCGAAPTCSSGMITPGGRCSASGACVAPGPSDTQPCPNGLACADGSSCKTVGSGGCATRANCASQYNDCNVATGICSPDVASQLAAKQGVTPAPIPPPPRLTNAQIAAGLVDAGFTPDDAGTFYMNVNDTNAPMQLAFDPKFMTPILTYKNCLEYIETCMLINKTIDGCVALAPRCATSTPWNGDPAGIECCPQACLVEYFNARPAESAPVALQSLASSTCYLGGSAVDGGAP
jgi:hypothetical protein